MVFDKLIKKKRAIADCWFPIDFNYWCTADLESTGDYFLPGKTHKGAVRGDRWAGDKSGEAGQDRQDRPGQPEKTVKIVQRGKVTEDRMARTLQHGQDS